MKITVDLIDVTIAIVAVYGALLSTYSVIRQSRETKRRVKVELSLGFIGGPMTGVSESQIFLEGANIGHMSVCIVGHSFRLPDQNQLILAYPESDVQFPVELAPGNSCKIWSPVAAIAESMRERGYKGKVKIRGELNAATGEKFQSKSFLIDLDSWRSQ